MCNVRDAGGRRLRRRFRVSHAGCVEGPEGLLKEDIDIDIDAEVDVDIGILAL